MSFNTFARSSPSSPLSQRQEVRPELPPRHPPVAKKRSYVNLMVGPDGPSDEQDLGGPDTADGRQMKKQSPTPPAIPPRHSSVLTAPTEQPSPKPDPTGSKMDAKLPEHERVRSTVSAPVPAPLAHHSRLVILNDAHPSSPPPPTKLGSADANLEFMKSLEDLTSIGSFVGSDAVASPVESKETTGGSGFTLDMNASLDDLVAALSEMESSLQTLEDASRPPPQVMSDPEKRRTSDTPAVETTLHFPQYQQQMGKGQPPALDAWQSQESLGLTSSLKSMENDEGEQGSVQGEDLVSSLRALGGEGNGTEEEGTDPVAATAGLVGGPGVGVQTRAGNHRPAVAPKPTQKPVVGPKPKNGFGKSK